MTDPLCPLRQKSAYLRMRLKSLMDPESLEHREQLDPDLQVAMGLYSCRAAASVISWSSSG